MNMKIAYTFLWIILFGLSVIQINATEKLPTNIGQFNKYLSKISVNDRIDSYSQIIDNLDVLILETNSTKNLSKIQKRKLINQYNIFKKRTQLLLTREQKKNQVNIDFWKILPKKEVITWSWIQNNTWATNQTIYTNNQPVQNYTTQTTQNVSNTPNSSSTIQNSSWSNSVATNTIAQKNNNIIFSSYWPSNLFIGWNGSSMFWWFSIKAWDEDIRIRKLVFKNTWTANLRDVIIGSNIKLWNIDQQSEVSSTMIIYNNSIVIESMNLSIRKNSQLNFNINTDIWAILWVFWQNIQLSLVPEDSEIYIDSSSSWMSLLWKNYIINNLIFPKIWIYGNAPYLEISRKSTTSALINFLNWNEEFDINIKSFKLDILSSQYGSKLNGMICFREEQSSISCKDNGAFIPRNITDGSSAFYWEVTPSLFSLSNTVSKRLGNNNKAKYELFLDWIYLDEAPRIIVSEIIYSIWWYDFKITANNAGNLENPILLN